MCVTFTMIVAWLGRWWCAHGVRLITYLREREERETMRDEKSIWFCVCMSVSSEWMRVYYEWDHPHTEQTESGFEDFDKLGSTKISTPEPALSVCVRRWRSVNSPEQQPKREVQFFCLMFGFVRTHWPIITNRWTQSISTASPTDICLIIDNH